MPRKTADHLPRLVQELANKIRSFEIDDKIPILLKVLKQAVDVSDSRTVIVDRLGFKALSLYAEYKDALGELEECRPLLQSIYSEFVDDLHATIEKLEIEPSGSEARKLLRQQVWCCLAYALCLYRADELREMEQCLTCIRSFVEDALRTRDFPLWGTRTRLAYYTGLLYRDQGRPEAARLFDQAIEFAVQRKSEKLPKYRRRDPKRAQREEMFMKGCLSRSLAFGHGGIAFTKGAYADARSLFIAAREMLAEHGHDMWRRAIDVYLEAGTLLGIELEPENAATVATSKERLEYLAKYFLSRNHRYASFAQAFLFVAELRQQQLNHGHLFQYEPRSLKKIEKCLADNGRTSGTLSTIGRLKLIECVVRSANHKHAKELLENLQTRSTNHYFVVPEVQLLQAELAMKEGRWDFAEATLTSLLETRSVGSSQKARAWALLSLIARKQGNNLWANRALGAALEVLPEVQDGYVRALIRYVEQSHESELWRLMPYQKGHVDSVPTGYFIDENIRASELNAIEAAHRRWPTAGVEDLADRIGRKKAWLYAWLDENDNLPWVRKIYQRRRLNRT